MMTALGKLLIVAGVVCLVAGLGLLAVGALGGRVPFLGRLPGDIHIEREGWSLHIPLATSLLLSVIVSLVLVFLSRR
jgi:hypothetical protein